MIKTRLKEDLCWEQTNLSSSSQHMGLHSFIAQLVEHCSVNAEVMDLNPVVSVFTQIKSTSFHISTRIAYPFIMLFYLFRAWPTNSSGTPTQDPGERFKERNSHSRRGSHVCVLGSQQKPSRVSLSQMEVLQKCSKWI